MLAKRCKTSDASQFKIVELNVFNFLSTYKNITDIIVNTDNGNFAMLMPVIIGDGVSTDPKRFEMTDNLSALKDKNLSNI